LLELARATAVGEQAEVTDTHESPGQDVEEEAADERLDAQGHGLESFGAAAITHAEPDLLIVEADEALIGDCDAVGVAAEIGDDLLGTGEGGLGVDHPIVMVQCAQEPAQLLRVGQRGAGTGELELGVLERLAQCFEVLSPEHSRQCPHRKEKAWLGGEPALAVGRERAAGHNAMHVDMVAKILAPRVQHHRYSEFAAEPAGIGGELAQSRRGATEQQVVHEAWVSEGEHVELVREGKDDVEVLLDREQIGAPSLHPTQLGQGLAAGTVAIATRMVVQDHRPAALTALEVSAEGRSTARLDRAHGTALLCGEPMSRAELLAPGTEDVSDLQRVPRRLRGRHWPSSAWAVLQQIER